jgi:hypothetical protein
MKNSTPDEDEIGAEYDLSDTRSNPHAQRYAEGTNLVRLDADVAKFFPDSDSVNRALRALVKIIEERFDAA